MTQTQSKPIPGPESSIGGSLSRVTRASLIPQLPRSCFCRVYIRMSIAIFDRDIIFASEVAFCVALIGNITMPRLHSRLDCSPYHGGRNFSGRTIAQLASRWTAQDYPYSSPVPRRTDSTEQMDVDSDDESVQIQLCMRDIDSVGSLSN